MSKIIHWSVILNKYFSHLEYTFTDETDYSTYSIKKGKKPTKKTMLEKDGREEILEKVEETLTIIKSISDDFAVSKGYYSMEFITAHCGYENPLKKDCIPLAEILDTFYITIKNKIITKTGYVFLTQEEIQAEFDKIVAT